MNLDPEALRDMTTRQNTPSNSHVALNEPERAVQVRPLDLHEDDKGLSERFYLDHLDGINPASSERISGVVVVPIDKKRARSRWWLVPVVFVAVSLFIEITMAMQIAQEYSSLSPPLTLDP